MCTVNLINNGDTTTVLHPGTKSLIEIALIPAVTFVELYEKSPVGSCKDTTINESYLIMYKLWKTKKVGDNGRNCLKYEGTR